MATLTIECKTWEDFEKGVRDFAKYEGQYFFRGQGNATWRLQSAWQLKFHKTHSHLTARIRQQTMKGKRNEFVEKFKTLALRIHSGIPEVANDKEWMKLGRHHGLITPLLDWTTSPYIAAFFAFAQMEIESSKSPKPTHVAVWAISQAVSKLNNEEFWFESGSKSGRYRQNAQCGSFTYLFAENYDCLERYLEAHDSNDVRKFVIEATESQKALYDLFLMNINFATIYPDLDGAAKEANRRQWYIDKSKFGIDHQ